MYKADYKIYLSSRKAAQANGYKGLCINCGSPTNWHVSLCQPCDELNDAAQDSQKDMELENASA